MLRFHLHGAVWPAGLAALVSAVVVLALIAVPARAQETGFDPQPSSTGITITSYTGTLDSLRSDAQAAGLQSMFATVGGEFVGYIIGAPEFVNGPFVSEFGGALDGQLLVVLAGGTQPGPSTPTPTPTTPTPTATPSGSSVLELRDGTWQVGDAGTVEFSADGGSLDLIDVSPASGWSVTEREVEDDEIEVQFDRANVDWTIEVELDDGILEIEIDQDIDGADPGTYTVGEAGTVEFALQGGALQLIEVAPNSGWTFDIDEASDDDIEVDFRRGNVSYDFDVELDDGEIDIDLDFEIEGPWPQ